MNDKVIMLIIPNLGRGGAQQVYRDQLAFFSRHAKVIGCVFNWDGAFPEDKALGIISLDVKAGDNWISKAYFFLKRIITLAQIKRKHQVDFAISHLEGADYVNLLSKQHEQVICWIHGTKIFDKNIAGPLGWLRKTLLIPITYGKAAHIVTVSIGIAQELRNIFGVPAAKLQTIYNGFDLSEISSKSTHALEPAVKTLFDNHTILITHCRLSRQKNLFRLLDLFAQLKTQPGIKLAILGDGELREDLLAYCKSLQLNTYTCWDNTSLQEDCQVYFFGYLSNPYPFLRHASLYLLTSSWEGFPLALCEAMACSVPVMAADCYTGPREILAPELQDAQPIDVPLISNYGVLMPLLNSDNEIQLWVQTIQEVLTNDTMRGQLVDKGINRIQGLDKRDIEAQWLDLLQ